MAKRISTSVDDELHDRLSAGIKELGVSRSDLLLALIELWDEDEVIKKRAADPAKRNREEAFRRQYLDRKPRQR